MPESPWVKRAKEGTLPPDAHGAQAYIGKRCWAPKPDDWAWTCQRTYGHKGQHRYYYDPGWGKR